jgi:voltage-gated potassium channel
MRYFRDRYRSLTDIYERIRKEKVPRLLLSFVAVVTIAGVLVYYIEGNVANTLFQSIGDGIWWGFVTIATVGYGDKYPVTVAGRIIGIFVMGSGMILTVILSGTIASIMVERKLKEGKGLQKINTIGHIIICGWNPGGTKILQGFQSVGEKLKKKHSIVLVNEMEIDALNEVQFTYNSKFLEVEFIRGNFTHEQVLDNANIHKAESVIVLADTSGENSAINADERTVLASYTISNLNPGARISAELINPQNEQHLKRTNVESIVISGEFNGFMLANSALFPGVPQALKEIMSFNLKNEITTRQIPSQMVGKKFEDLFRYMKDRENALLIGVISETKKLSIDDFLSEDPSSIDEFIKRKFAESEKDLFADTGGKISILVNPGWSYVINEFDKALVIGEVKGKQ